MSLAGADSIDEIRRRVAARVENTPPGTWIITTPVGDPPWFFRVPESLRERRFPSRWDLDSVSPDHPVYITAPTNRVSNTAILNSYALRLAGIGRDTPRDYEGIEVEKDPVSGEPTGELHGMQPIYNPSRFFERFSRLLTPLTYDDVRRGIRNLAPAFIANGTTTLLEAHLTSPEELRAYVELERRGELGLRVFYTFEINSAKSMAEIEQFLRTMSFLAGKAFGTERFRIAGVSIGLDGPHWHGSAVAGEPYMGPYGKSVDPQPLVPPDTYRAIIKLAAQCGLRVHAEAAGRGSIAIALAAMRDANSVRPSSWNTSSFRRASRSRSASDSGLFRRPRRIPSGAKAPKFTRSGSDPSMPRRRFRSDGGSTPVSRSRRAPIGVPARRSSRCGNRWRGKPD